MDTLAQNEAAYNEIKLKGRAVSPKINEISLETSLFGDSIPSPIAIASTAFHKMAHPLGEVATGAAAEASNKTALLLSSWATTDVEEVSQSAPNCYKMFQIYMSKVKEVNLDVWQKVKQSGFKVMCLTTDTQHLGKRESDVRNRFQLPSHLTLAVYEKYRSKSNTQEINKSSKESALAEYVRNHKDNTIDWSTIGYVKEKSGLKVFAKGVMSYEDTIVALQNGADGIFVSNHGARQLDTTPATI